MNTLFIIYTFVALVCLFSDIILTCEATRQKHQIDELQGRCEYLSKQVESLVKIADKSSEINHLVKDRLDNFSDTLDLYKKVYDSFNDAYAQLNFRVQQLEMLNSNGAVLTGEYDPNNPPSILLHKNNEVEKGIYPTCEDNQNISDSKPETITFTKED